MRIGIFTREYPPNVYGGAGVHVEYLTRELAKRAEVDVYCWGDQRSDEEHLHVHGQQPWSEITDGTTGKFKGALEALSLNLAQVRDLRGIDIVHTHTWYVAMAGFLAKKLYRIPFVLTTHSLEPLRAWKAEQLGRGYEMSSWMERTAIMDADAVVAVSKGTRGDILRVYPVPEDRVHVIYNGVDLDEYKRTSDTTALSTYGIDANVPYVLFVGRITRQKGVTNLADAIAFLPKDTQVVLCAGAPDTPEIAQEMREKVEQAKKVNPKIVWIEKMISKPEVIQLYSHARVFCCPSVYEPFGIINVEAMACGAPVVASAIGGIPEIVVDGETGYLVTFKTDKDGFPAQPEQFARDLAAKLTRLLDDPDLSRKFGEAGRKRAEQQFSWPSIASQTLQMYQELIDRTQSAAKASA